MDLTGVLSELYDWLVDRQQATIKNAADACKAKVWMLYDPNFRKEKQRYFPPDRADRRIEWRQANPGSDLYEPSSAACQLNISVSFLKYSVRNDPLAPMIMGRGMIACNTPALQWWNRKKHHTQVVSLDV
jgi:hypothetical protein